MKYKPAAIFVVTIFLQAGGGMATFPQDPLLQIAFLIESI